MNNIYYELFNQLRSILKRIDDRLWKLYIGIELLRPNIQDSNQNIRRAHCVMLRKLQTIRLSLIKSMIIDNTCLVAEKNDDDQDEDASGDGDDDVPRRGRPLGSQNKTYEVNQERLNSLRPRNVIGVVAAGTEPLTFDDAVDSEESMKWFQAMTSEMNSLIENKTFTLVDPPNNNPVITSKWIYRIKSDGRYKARLVARGFQQQHNVDYFDTYAPVKCRFFCLLNNNVGFGGSSGSTTTTTTTSTPQYHHTVYYTTSVPLITINRSNQVFYRFVCNLALADLLVVLFCLIPTLIGNIYLPWVLGRSVCKAVPYLQGVSVNASVYTLVAISIDRFYAIYYPLSKKCSTRMCWTTIILIWLFSMIISFPWLVYFDVFNIDVGNDFPTTTTTTTTTTTATTANSTIAAAAAYISIAASNLSTIKTNVTATAATTTATTTTTTTTTTLLSDSAIDIMISTFDTSGSEFLNHHQHQHQHQHHHQMIMDK
nr:uncharacterized protein LOC124498358 [Dermatophagoides farinae]